MPLLFLVVLVGWQVIAVAWSAVRAEEGARRDALAAQGTAGVPRTVRSAVTVPGLAGPGVTLTIRAVVLP